MATELPLHCYAPLGAHQYSSRKLTKLSRLGELFEICQLYRHVGPEPFDMILRRIGKMDQAPDR